MDRKLFILFCFLYQFADGYGQENYDQVKSLIVKVSEYIEDSLSHEFISKKMELNRTGDTTLLIYYYSKFNNKPEFIIEKKYFKDNAYKIERKRFFSNGLRHSKTTYSYDTNDSLVYSEIIEKTYRNPYDKKRGTHVTIDKEKIERNKKGIKISSERYHKNPFDKASRYKTNYFYNEKGLMCKTEHQDYYGSTSKKVNYQRTYDYIDAPDLSEYHTIKNDSNKATYIYNSDYIIIQRKYENSENIYYYDKDSSLLKRIHTIGKNDSSIYHYTYVTSDSFNIVTEYKFRIKKLRNGVLYSHTETQKKYNIDGQLLKRIHSVKYDSHIDSAYPKKWDEFHLICYNENNQILRKYDSTFQKVNDNQFFYSKEGNITKKSLFKKNTYILDSTKYNLGLPTTRVEYDKQTGSAFTSEKTVFGFRDDGKRGDFYEEYINGTLSRSIEYSYNEFDLLIKQVDEFCGSEKYGSKNRRTITNYIYSYF